MIGRYYHGWDHSTVIHGIQRIEALRERDPEVDALFSELKAQLEHTKDGFVETGNSSEPQRVGNISCDVNIAELANCIAERVWARLRQHLAKDSSDEE